jgi:hypothetical protein
MDSHYRNLSSSNLRSGSNVFINNLQNENVVYRTPSRANDDVKQLEKLKNKLRDLEHKVVNFNKGRCSDYNQFRRE